MIAALVCAECACQKPETRFEVESFKDRQFSQRFSESFEDGYYCVSPNKNYTFVFEVLPTYIDAPAKPETADSVSDEPAGDEPEISDTGSNVSSESIRMSQAIEISVFWKPRPGTTFAESTQTNANIVYCLITGRDCITYEGAGFVSFTESRDGQSVSGLVESAALYPARTVNAPNDLFGPCRFSGTFVAKKDPAAVVARQLRLRKRLGPPISASVTASSDR